MDDKILAKKILKFVGGTSNISSVTHCVTRLRISVNNKNIIEDKEIAKLTGVLGTQHVGNQFQVVLGGKVQDVYKEFLTLVDLRNQNSEDSDDESKTSLINRFLDTLSGIFVPILPAIIGAGLLKAILLTLMFSNLVETDSDTYQLLNVFSDTGYYFLPILIANSAALRFKCNNYIAMMLAGIMLHPSMVSLMADKNVLSFFGIPIQSVSYGSSVIPIVFGVLFMSYVEKLLRKYIPKIIQTILVPLLTILITAPIVLATIGPVTKYIGDAIGSGFMSFYLSPFSIIAGALFGALFPYLVLTGMHNGFTPVMLQTLSKYGVDYLMGLNVSSNAAQAGATFSVFLKTKNKKFKTLAGTAALNAILGITEPALFGVTSRLKKPLIAVSIGGAVGGAIAGFFKVEALGLATGPIIGIPLFVGPTFIWFIVSSTVSCIVAFLAANIIGFEDIPEESEIKETSIERNGSTKDIALESSVIYSPLSGEVLQLNQVSDKVFSSKMMGEGIAILPDEGKVYAPFSGSIEMIFPTGHAVGLKSSYGVELLIHVGLDTVDLNGEGYTYFVKQGDVVAKGDLLIEFDIDTIKAAGYDTVTPIVITNTSEYASIVVSSLNKTVIGDEIIKVEV